MSKKGTKALASATLMSLVLTTALSAGPVKAAQGSVTRVGESDRYATAASVATENWKDGSDDVVLVSGEGYADAVSASALAKKLNAPILLTTAGSLNTDAKDALSKLKAKNVYIVGGNASVNASVRSDLKASYNLVELQGKNRYETNVAVAKKLVELGVKADNVLLVGGEGFSDALSVAPVAAAKGQILLLGNNNSDSMQSVVDFVKANNSKVTVVGTKNVISEDILSSLGDGATRVDGGSDRFDTNLKVLNSFKSDLKTDKLYVANATGTGYADALVASALAGKTASPLVLVDTETSDATTNAISYIKNTADPKKTDLQVVGGTGVVSDTTVKNINDAVSGGKPTPGQTTVQSIEAMSLNQIKIHFNCAIDSDSAEDVTNYKIDGTQLTALNSGKAVDGNGAVAKAVDDNTVVITLATARKQYDDVTVSVKKAVLTEDKNNTVDAFDQSVTFTDTTVPTIKNVTVEGNSQLTVEFSESVDMKTIQDLKSKFKIDGQSIGNYSVNTSYSKVKNSIDANGQGNIASGNWGFKVLFYFDSPLPSGNHTLKVSDGDKDGALSDAAGFTFKEASQDFTVDTMTTKPVVKSVKESKSGEISIEFDRSMDVQTAENASNYEINGDVMTKATSYAFDDDNAHTIIKLQHVGKLINTGSNTLYIKNNVKDAFGNKIADDTRVSFDDLKDETKPTVTNLSIIDSETIRVKFSKDVDYSYATNTSNYKLLDNKDLDITSHIDKIVSTAGDTDDTDTYNIKLKKYSADSKEDWRLTGAKYTLTIKNIIDTASTPNTMEDYTTTLNGDDDIAPKGTGIYAKLRGTTGDKDKVVVYFSEAMDSSTLTNKDNFKFVNGEGDTKTLPSDATVTAGGDDKSAIIEFPSSYKVLTDASGKTDGTTNQVTGVIASNVKDEAGNLLDGVAYNNNKNIDAAKQGAQVKANTVKTYYDGDDLKVDIQFDKAVDEINPSDFTLGGIHPTSGSVNGDKVTLTFKDEATVTSDDTTSTITYANKKTNTSPYKIDLVKALGQAAKLNITATGTKDETGALVSVQADGLTPAVLTDAQAKVYDYQAAPRTTCFDNTDKDPNFFSVERDASGTKAYVTFDTILDTNSGIKSDDFTFTGQSGTDIKPDSVSISGNTVIFQFNTSNKDYTNALASATTVDIRAKSTVSLRTEKDVDGNNANYVPSSDDLKKRTVTVTGAATDAVSAATALVVKAEASKTQADKDAALVAVNALPDSTTKTSLLARVNAIVVPTATLSVTKVGTYNPILGYVDITVNDSSLATGAKVDGTAVTADNFKTPNATTVRIFADAEPTTITITTAAGDVPAKGTTTPTTTLTFSKVGTYNPILGYLDITVNDSSLATGAKVDGTAVAADSFKTPNATTVRIFADAEPTTIVLTSANGDVTVK